MRLPRFSLPALFRIPPPCTSPPGTLTPDQAAADFFLSDLRTRITTQPLPYQYGVESSALRSLWMVFVQARAAMRRHPGCEEFARLATDMLNMHLRPMTAKWDKAFAEGRLNSRDGADEFREDLTEVQRGLRRFSDELQIMAYGRKRPDGVTPPALTPEDLAPLAAPLPFGIPADSLLGPENAKKLNDSERTDVLARRHLRLGAGNGDPRSGGATNAFGLALSGGGIRSAVFSLGVVQTLAARGMLGQVDFLSTVSGGGYTGSFITRRLGDGAACEEIGRPHGPDPQPVRYLRQHAKYLAARNIKESWGMVTATLAGMLLNWAVPLVILIAAAIEANFYSSIGWNAWPWLCAFFGLVSAVALLFYGDQIRGSQNAARRSGTFLAVVLAAALACCAGWAVTAVYYWKFHGWSPRFNTLPRTLALAVPVLVAAGPAMIRFLPIFKDPPLRKLVLGVLLWAAGVLVPLLALAVFYTFWRIAEHPFGPAHGMVVKGWVFLLVSAGILSFIDILLLNINLTSPHRLYRDCLDKAFVQRSETSYEDALLREINPLGTAPYHLINATLNVPNSQHASLRDRRSDFFLFSKHWTGSPSTGYQETGKWLANNQAVNLATAIAISGAAISTYMGLSSMPSLTALLTFLNIRLGFWIKRPGTGGILPHPGFVCLLREMFGVWMSERQKWINLSDGGHIENMGVYELLRRRCKFILCVDGESDPGYTFQGLMTLVRHAQIDFGARIEPRLDDMRPDPATGLSQSHSHFCRIYYQDRQGRSAGMGFLLYLKLSATGNETELIKRYRIDHPAFPHQSTLEQFFDEEQFEAYRELGTHVAEGLFSKSLLNRTEPRDVQSWFTSLAGNLLVPESEEIRN